VEEIMGDAICTNDGNLAGRLLWRRLTQVLASNAVQGRETATFTYTRNFVLVYVGKVA
jgi:hypothetical protein